MIGLFLGEKDLPSEILKNIVKKKNKLFYYRSYKK